MDRGLMGVWIAPPRPRRGISRAVRAVVEREAALLGADARDALAARVAERSFGLAPLGRSTATRRSREGEGRCETGGFPKVRGPAG